MAIGQAVGWNHPAAVAFGRRMYEAIKGHAAPQDLMAATDADKADVGVWVTFWIEHVQARLDAGRYVAFEDRCFADVRKKRNVRGIRNLGALARKTIVPGVLAAMG